MALDLRNAPPKLAALLAISTFANPSAAQALSLDDPRVRSLRLSMGGQIQPIPRTQARWYLSDVDSAAALADNGDLRKAAQLMTAAMADGTLRGVLSTRTAGLVRLPKRFRGFKPAIDLLALRTGEDEDTRSYFDEMCPASELGLLAADGEALGVGVGELEVVEGREHPRLVRLDPEFLRYQWSENRWYFRSVAGMIPITPGDGRWVLHVPGGKIAPWRHGLWRALGRAYIRKAHAGLHKDNWEAKLANPARVAYAPSGATVEQADGWFRQVMAWGINTVFGLRPGYEVKLLESNGRGYESFSKTISEQNQEIVIAVAGQTVTTDGGAGFANADIHKSIRADLIKATADALAHTVNTQILPAWLVGLYGEEALDQGVTMSWDVTPPKDLAQEADALTKVAGAIKALTEALALHGEGLDVHELCERFAVPLADLTPEVAAAAENAQNVGDSPENPALLN